MLVVVLIIGILAAIALPQYKRAVLRTRFAEMMSVAKTIKDAEELYFLQTGEYILRGEGALFNNLDISQFSKCGPWQTNGITSCKNFFINIDTGNPHNYDTRMVMIGNSQSMSTNNTLGYALYFDKSRIPGRKECWASVSDKTADDFCKSVGTFQTEYHNETSMKSPFNVYLMN
jgi:type IV pilus assembly protein PilE